MFGLMLAAAGVITAVAMFWALPTSFLGGNAAAAGIAFVNCTGNLGGFFSPAIIGFLKTQTGTLNSGLYLIAAMHDRILDPHLHAGSGAVVRLQPQEEPA